MAAFASAPPTSTAAHVDPDDADRSHCRLSVGGARGTAFAAMAAHDLRRSYRQALRPALDVRLARAGHRQDRQRRCLASRRARQGSERSAVVCRRRARRRVERPHRVRRALEVSGRHGCDEPMARWPAQRGCRSTARSRGSTFHCDRGTPARSPRTSAARDLGISSALGARVRRSRSLSTSNRSRVTGRRSLLPSHAVRTNSSSNVPMKPGPGCQ